MAAMVIVNNPGDWRNIYWPLGHAEWDGWTPTDLIFPFFLFIVGVALTLSTTAATARSILRRSAILLGLGLFLNGFPFFNLATIRLPGVLQRIGLCYLAAAFAYRWAQSPGDSGRPARSVALRVGAVAVFLLVGYWLLLHLVPGASGARFDLSRTGNVGAIIDRAVLGTHTWRRGWDPEGLLSTVPSVGTTLVGVLFGLWLRIARERATSLVATGAASSVAGRSDAERERAVQALTLRGLVYGGLAVTLIGAVWSLEFPLIKNIWTSSYALFGAGLGALTLAACYWVADVRRWRATHPLVVLGTNAITLFVVSGLVTKLLIAVKVDGPFGAPVALRTWIYRRAFEAFLAPMHASLLFAVANLAVLYVLLWWMYRKRVFLRV